MTYGRRERERRGHDAREKARKFLVKEGKGNPPQKPTPSAASLKSQHEKGPSLLPCSCRTRALDVLRLGQPSDVGRLCRLGRHGGKRPWDIGNILRRLACIFNPSQDTVLETGSKEPLELRSYAGRRSHKAASPQERCLRRPSRHFLSRTEASRRGPGGTLGFDDCTTCFRQRNWQTASLAVLSCRKPTNATLSCWPTLKSFSHNIIHLFV